MPEALTPSRSHRADWLIPIALLVLTAVPFAAGVFRLVSLARGAGITPANARFFASPCPVVIHIFSVTVYCLLGAFQFAPAFRRRNPQWHRLAGRLLVVCGLASALSGLWMTLFYPVPLAMQGNLLWGFRILVGTAMAWCIAAGLVTVLRRDFARHQAWMIRAYAIGQGAGTQALTMLPWALILGEPRGLTRDLLMGGSWLINLVIAEWIIRRQPRLEVSTVFLTPAVAGQSMLSAAQEKD
jgi:uncharacterized membrane protein